MARKNSGNGGSSRDKKSVTTSKPAPMQVVPEIRNGELRSAEVRNEVRNLEVRSGEARKNMASLNLDEEIRRRAYEIYLERGGTAGNQQDDWSAAEREVRSRHQQQHTA